MNHMNDLAKITEDYFLSTPEKAGEVLLAALQSDLPDDDIKRLFAACEARGIDPFDAAMQAQERHRLLEEKFRDPATRIGGSKEIGVPFRYEEKA